MANSQKTKSDLRANPKPARDPESRQMQVAALAIDEAERRILDHSASSQIICHFLDLVTEETRLKREKLESENELLKAKKTAIESEKTIEELYSKAIDAMRIYSGESPDD